MVPVKSSLPVQSRIRSRLKYWGCPRSHPMILPCRQSQESSCPRSIRCVLWSDSVSPVSMIGIILTKFRSDRALCHITRCIEVDLYVVARSECPWVVCGADEWYADRSNWFETRGVPNVSLWSFVKLDLLFSRRYCARLLRSFHLCDESQVVNVSTQRRLRDDDESSSDVDPDNVSWFASWVWSPMHLQKVELFFLTQLGAVNDIFELKGNRNSWLLSRACLSLTRSSWPLVSGLVIVGLLSLKLDAQFKLIVILVLRTSNPLERFDYTWFCRSNFMRDCDSEYVNSVRTLLVILLIWKVHDFFERYGISVNVESFSSFVTWITVFSVYKSFLHFDSTFWIFLFFSVHRNENICFYDLIDKISCLSARSCCSNP